MLCLFSKRFLPSKIWLRKIQQKPFINLNWFKFGKVTYRNFVVKYKERDEEDLKNNEKMPYLKTGLERLLQDGDKPDKSKITEYDDVDQIHQSTVYDPDDVVKESDSEEELDAILEIDLILKEFHNEPESASHKRIYKLFTLLSKVDEVLELDSEIMTEVIENIVSPQLPYFSDLNQVTDISQIALEIKLKNNVFWSSISHSLAVNYNDMDIGNIIQLIYMMYSNSLNTKIQVNKNYIEGSEMQKEKVFKRLSFENIIKDIRDSVEIEMKNLESSTAFNVLNIVQILYLHAVAKIDLLPEDYGEDKLLNYLSDLVSGGTIIKDNEDKSTTTNSKEEIEIVDDYIDTLNQFTKFFKLTNCLHLLQIIIENHSMLEDKPDLMKFITYQIMQNFKNKEFFKGSVITFKEISQFLEGIRIFKISDDELDDAIEVVEFLLTKAISISDRNDINLQNKNNANENNEAKEVIKSENQVAELNNKNELQLVKAKLEIMKHLTSILIDYGLIKTPSERAFALLAFEADYIIKSYLNEPVQVDDGYSGEHIKFNQNEIPKEVIKSYIQFQQLLSKTFNFETLKNTNKKGRINMIKKNYLRLINLILHNESFQEQADEKIYLILMKIQGKGIVDEDILQDVLKIMKLRIHAYNSLTNID